MNASLDGRITLSIPESLVECWFAVRVAFVERMKAGAQRTAPVPPSDCGEDRPSHWLCSL
jgi:hypothetical protein